ncbi:hypothetical protein K491DRAFT_658013 [Lophiostoma macrostomum CBS 122681]|uniref:HTH La-type RNA-binding domain-containing protein n=1 Tax=Lophiostoma macrostomum CBS 122681 TaxID=1314788 RepID=A0A6A6T6A9_9PLEO|nr:hypothetical protein K491DRAFT_658013 [Lophiostoma macrostomum CBS 122681]
MADVDSPAIIPPELNGGPVGGLVEEEHPDAPAIRRQVEFYFSDENLPTDLHLLKCCDGRKNEPVSISRICGFKKMRVFKKKVVIRALRDSTFLNVSDDGKTVWRKVPLVGPCLLDEDYHVGVDSDDDIAYDPRTKRQIAHPVPRLPQQKKAYPEGTSKNMLKPTGFEDTHVEGPLTPQEAEEEMAMYDPDKPFAERIEIAIQRFKQKRRMHEMYAKIFNKWMKFGGVECEPQRMFGGLSQAEMKEMTGEEIARATATHHVPWDREEKNKWAVDFFGVAEAFLSSYYPAHYGHDPKQVKTACQVLRSFYNYLLFHNVCDEHRDSLMAARALCDKADFELPQVYRAGTSLPGPFNVGASTIFGGSHAGTYTGLSSWTQDMSQEDLENSAIGTIGMRNEAAKVTFMTGVAAYGTDEQYDLLTQAGATLQTLKITASESTGLEVIAINKSTEEIREVYAQQNEAWKRKINLQPLGKLVCKRWQIEDFKEYDLPPSKTPNKSKSKSQSQSENNETGELEFWIEDDVLAECFVGMKLEATVLTLAGGIIVLDEVKEVFCSFYKWLPNDLWAERKPPRFRLMKKWLDGTGEEEGDGKVGANGNGNANGKGKGKKNGEMDEGEMSDDFEE